MTGRELEVLRLAATGQSDQEIAEALFISPRTVSRHLTAIFAKLDVKTRTAAAAAPTASASPDEQSTVPVVSLNVRMRSRLRHQVWMSHVDGTVMHNSWCVVWPPS